MRLVFVHGMRQEGQDPTALKTRWETALTETWVKLGLPPRHYDLEMPFYGDVLEELTAVVRGGASNVVARGSVGPQAFTPLEESLIRGMARKAGVTDAEVNRELGQEVVSRGPLNWELVHALANLLEKKVPVLGKISLGFVTQVDSYLTRPHIRKAVDDIVAPTFDKGPTIVVAHSLGTIVSYILLRTKVNRPDVPLLVTLGSPLGIETVKGYLRPPSLAVPDGVSFWLNGADVRDYVALVPPLDKETFSDGIVNDLGIHNREDDAHSIEDYLSDFAIAQRIHAAIE
jgi:hypothetical protein